MNLEMIKKSLVISLLLFPLLTQAQEWIYKEKRCSEVRTSGDEFGKWVHISGTYMIVAEPSDDYDVNGSNFKSQSGAVVMFEQDINGDWIKKQKLVASDRNADDLFGLHCAIDGNYAVVGAFRQSYDAAGGNFRSSAGAAYVFERNSSGTWVQVQKLVASDRTSGNEFGYGVSVSGDYIAVSGGKNGTDATGGNFKSEAGACYIFKRNSSGTWVQIQKLVASDRNAGDHFAHNSIEISSNKGYLAVGAMEQDYDANGGNAKFDAGACYIFEENSSGTWVQVAKLVASDRETGAIFGGNPCIHENMLMLASYNETKDENGNNPLFNAGAAYFFERDTNGNWVEKQKIVNSYRGANDRMGSTIAIQGSLAVIGAPGHGYDANGANFKSKAGAAYFFIRGKDGKWKETEKIVAPDRNADDHFGRQDFYGQSFVSGASFQDYDSMRNNFVSNAGAIYIYKRRCAVYDSVTVNACNSYRSPSGKYVWDTDGTYKDTIAGGMGCDSIISITLRLEDFDLNVTLVNDSLVAQDDSATYQWLDCDNGFSPVAGQTTSTFVPTKSGNYAVQLNKNNCQDTTECYFFQSSGYKGMDVIQAALYPNPSDGKFRIDGIYGEVVNIEVYNGKGQLVARPDYTDHFDLSFLSDGLYSVKIITSGSVYSGRIWLHKE